MDVNAHGRWIDLSNLEIPAIEHPGFESDVLERDIWNHGSEIPEPVAAVPAEPEITLTRVNSPDGEVIHVESDIFTLGKSSKADYTIKGNSAISRIHAMIYRSGNDYYLEDQNSLNHTYVDEEMITRPYKLRSGLVVRLANEDFILRME